MRDQEHAEAGGLLRAIHTLRDDLQRVDVESGVGLVEHRDRVDFQQHVGCRKFDANDRVDRVVVTEILVEDLDLDSVEGEPVAGIGHVSAQLDDVGCLSSLGLDHSDQSIENRVELFHRTAVFGR